MAYNAPGMGVVSIPPDANLEDQRDSLRQTRDLLKHLHLDGLQVTQVTQAQIAQMVTAGSLSQVSKLFYSIDETYPNNLKIGMIDGGGNFVIKTVTVS
jgi:hypothetical protein